MKVSFLLVATCCFTVAWAERYLPQWQRKLEYRESLERREQNRRLWQQDESVQEHKRRLQEHLKNTKAVDVEVDPASTNGDTVRQLQQNIFMPETDDQLVQNVTSPSGVPSDYFEDAFLTDGPSNVNMDRMEDVVAQDLSTSAPEQDEDDEDGPQLVFNGDNAVRGAFPYYVDLFADNTSICGGSLIHPRVVLTAAHCNADATGTVSTPQLIGKQVRVGALDQTGTADGSQLATVVQQIIHPQYSQSATGATPFFLLNDVMLLILDREVIISQTPELRLSRNPADITPGNDMVIIGLGATLPGGLAPAQTLQVSTIVAVSDNFCDQIFPESSFCAGIAPGSTTRQNTNTCTGDSGGPILFADGDIHYQVGLVSYGPATCDGTGLTRFAQIPGYEVAGFNWIYEQVCEELGFDDATFCGGQECICDEDCNVGYDCTCPGDDGKNSRSRRHHNRRFLQDYENNANVPDDYKREHPTGRNKEDETFESVQSVHSSRRDTPRDSQRRRRAKSSSGKGSKSCKSAKSCKSSAGPVCIDNGELSGEAVESIRELNVAFL